MTLLAPGGVVLESVRVLPRVALVLRVVGRELVQAGRVQLRPAGLRAGRLARPRGLRPVGTHHRALCCVDKRPLT